VPARLPEQLVVDVRQQAEFVFLGQLLQLRVGLLEGLPALHGVGQEARARGLQLPLQAFGDLDRGAPEHLGVQLVGTALDFLGDLVKQRDQHVAVDLELVALGLFGERLVDAGLPVDQGSVDIECDERDVLWYWHRAGIMPRRDS
jgi:hypothetical protein